MTDATTVLAPQPVDDEPAIAERIAKSVSCADGKVLSLDEFHRWFAASAERNYTVVERIPLDELAGWATHPVTGNIAHESGKFFTIEGLDVRLPDAAVRAWTQPIINQPEIGILGILVKEFDGVLHCLMQAKVEPGNRNGVQLSPTVQATRSNYTRVHQGRPVPYLEYFRDRSGDHRVVADVRQSEQGSWFHHKRNRNMIIEVSAEVEVLDGFCWLSLGQVHALLHEEDVVNMDARTVLSCLPFAGPTAAGPHLSGDGFRTTLVRSCETGQPDTSRMGDLLAWITEARTRTDVYADRIPLNEVSGWQRDGMSIRHESGKYFNVIGVGVRAGGREVRSWCQPMIEPIGIGVVGMLVKRIDGVLHCLMHTRVEPGYVDVVELAPTVQCTPENYAELPAAAHPPFLGEVLGAGAARIRYDNLLSEEGGRFHHALNRYVVVETELDVPPAEFPGYRWLSLRQLTDLLRHSHYVNIQARSIVACLHSLYGTAGERGSR
jgi:oxidase EvaA